MIKILRKLFLVREIISQAGVLHFQRWRIFYTSWFALYIHRIYQADRDDHLHSHPWNFVSLILSGGYDELTDERRWYPAGSFIYHKHSDFHKIIELDKPTTTLVFTWGKRKPWGFLVDGSIIDNDSYRAMKKLEKE